MADLKQERAVRTRNLIMRAAAELFDEEGYEGASVSRIVKRAGVTLGAMYFHFDSKQDLAREVMNAQPYVIEPLLKSSGLQRLVDITLVWAHRLQTDPMLRAGVRLAVEQDRFGMHDSTSFEGWKDIMVSHLEVARAEGNLREGVSTEEVAQFVVGACTGMQLYSQLVTGREDLMERTCAMWRLLLPALVTPDADHAIVVDPDFGKAS
ncbi:ScbR family autoregulator-binding transcription factor [Streptomyces sp. MK37H]|uniref:ScbR family autoregulator-binding transcription factor n=1 Tax=Streptomyces sp. MK37H TaxID=2699117 RepID=UPI001B378140|nr:TetR family transcriptional regulator [Streptomyces sp. MK37H]